MHALSFGLVPAEAANRGARRGKPMAESERVLPICISIVSWVATSCCSDRGKPDGSNLAQTNSLCNTKLLTPQPQALAKWHSLYSGTGASRPVHGPRFLEEPGGSRRLRYNPNTK